MKHSAQPPHAKKVHRTSGELVWSAHHDAHVGGGGDGGGESPQITVTPPSRQSRAVAIVPASHHQTVARSGHCEYVPPPARAVLVPNERTHPRRHPQAALGTFDRYKSD